VQRHGWIVRKGAWLSAPRDRGVPGSAVSNGKLTRQTGRGAKWKCLIARPDPDGLPPDGSVADFLEAAFCYKNWPSKR